MHDEGREAALATRVSSMVRAYVRGRTGARVGIAYDDIPTAPDPTTGRPRKQYPERWRDAQPKVAQEAFLAMRARRSRQAFAEYFTGTICSVPQYLPDSELRTIATALLTDGDDGWEDVRSLAMLAISTMARV